MTTSIDQDLEREQEVEDNEDFPVCDWCGNKLDETHDEDWCKYHNR